MSEFYEFKCGCKIPIIDGEYHIDFNNLNYDCPITWDLYCNGYTQSIFQLESYLGKKWSSELKPRSIEDAAALISIIRPGTLNSHDENGKSLTKLFCERKNGQSQIDSNDPLYKYASDTQCIQIYQETILKICRNLGKLSNNSQASLLKALGKKKSDILLNLRKEFIQGALSTGEVTEEQANLIFDNIESAGRYSFNKAHAVSYAVVGYQTAWVKAHLPAHYICAWLRISKNEAKKLEEIRSVISESNRLQIPVKAPSLINLPKTDFFIKDNVVYFGISSIKNCSDKTVDKLIQANVDIESYSWLEFLLLLSDKLNKTQLVSMIRAGCFDYTGYARIYCEYQFTQWEQVTKTQKKKIIEHFENGNFNDLCEVIESFIQNAKLSKKDQENLPFIVEALKNPSIELYDSPSNVIAHEKQLMGINISCSKIQRASIPLSQHKTTDVNTAQTTKYYNFILVGEIAEYKEFKIKNGKLAGQLMANFKIVDSHGDCDVVIFPDSIDKFQSALYDGNVVMISGKKSNRGGIILDACYEV